MKNYKSEFYKCDCHHHAIEMSFWPDDDDEFVALTMWQYGGGSYWTLRDKLRHIWNIVRKGYPWNDSLLLSREDARRFATKLLEYTLRTGNTFTSGNAVELKAREVSDAIQENMDLINQRAKAIKRIRAIWKSYKNCEDYHTVEIGFVKVELHQIANALGVDLEATDE